jgi:hypothetical protein
MRKPFMPLLAAAVTLVSLIMSGGTASAGSETKFELSADRETWSINQKIKVELQADPVADLKAFDAVLLYDPAKLEFIGAKPKLPGVSEVSVYRGEGKLTFGYHLKDKHVVNGSAVLAELTFEAKSAGAATLTLDTMRMINSVPQTDAYESIGESIRVTIVNSKEDPPVPESPESPVPPKDMDWVRKLVNQGNQSSEAIKTELGLFLERISRMDTGELHITQTGNLLKVSVDQEAINKKLQEVLQALEDITKELKAAKRDDLGSSLMKAIQFDVPENTGEDMRLWLPADSVRKLTEQGFGITVANEQASVGIPAGSIDPQADKAQHLEVKISSIPNDDSPEMDGTLNPSGLKQASGIFDFGISRIKGNQAEEVTQFHKKIAIRLAYSGAELQEDKLGTYYLNPVTRQWEYVGGKVHKANRTVTAETGHFSTYAVMEFDKTFDDIQEHWAQHDIEVMASKHIIDGISDRLFAPDSNVTRAQFAKLIVQGLGLQDTGAVKAFDDVPADVWYANCVRAAAAHELMEGDGRYFRPEDPITREEMTTIIMRAYSRALNVKLPAASLSHFIDKSLISSWAQEPTGQALAAGLIQGVAADLFAPKATATRAESSTLIKRLHEKLP